MEIEVKHDSRNDLLKILAIVLMIIDHTGFAFFPQYKILRIIGRLSFPIFAYMIARGYQHTKDVDRYALRLFIFGLFSQIPFILLFKSGLNIFFTLLMGLLAIKFYDSKTRHMLGAVIIASSLLPLDYGLFGVLSIIVFHIYRDNIKLTVLYQLIITIGYVVIHGTTIQMFSVLALFLIFREWKIKLTLNKYIYYAIYPVHILLFFMIQKFLPSL